MANTRLHARSSRHSDTGSQKWDDTKNGPAETAGPISGALPKLRIFENSIGL